MHHVDNQRWYLNNVDCKNGTNFKEIKKKSNLLRLFLYISLINGVFAKTSTIGKKFGNKELIQNAGNFVSSRSLTANLQPESVAVLPNPRFIFHNKIPKAGSTTMSNILQALEDRNGFDMLHFRPCVEQREYKGVMGACFLNLRPVLL